MSHLQLNEIIQIHLLQEQLNSPGLCRVLNALGLRAPVRTAAQQYWLPGCVTLIAKLIVNSH